MTLYIADYVFFRVQQNAKLNIDSLIFVLEPEILLPGNCVHEVIGLIRGYRKNSLQEPHFNPTRNFIHLQISYSPPKFSPSPRSVHRIILNKFY